MAMSDNNTNKKIAAKMEIKLRFSITFSMKKHIFAL